MLKVSGVFKNYFTTLHPEKPKRESITQFGAGKKIIFAEKRIRRFMTNKLLFPDYARESS